MIYSFTVRALYPEEMRINPVSTCSVAGDGKNYITDTNTHEI
jgi:hypothetical protein